MDGRYSGHCPTGEWAYQIRPESQRANRATRKSEIMSEKPSPFELGRQHKLAGIKGDDKRCPYRTHSIEWVRYQNGRQSVNDEQAKRERGTERGTEAAGND